MPIRIEGGEGGMIPERPAEGPQGVPQKPFSHPAWVKQLKETIADLKANKTTTAEFRLAELLNLPGVGDTAEKALKELAEGSKSPLEVAHDLEKFLSTKTKRA